MEVNKLICNKSPWQQRQKLEDLETPVSTETYSSLISFLLLSTQAILRRRIGRRVSGKAWSAPSRWLSSSVSCLLRPIRCCGTAWSNQLHCEHGERTEQPWPHILSLQPKLDQPQPEHFSKQSVQFLFIYYFFLVQFWTRRSRQVWAEWREEVYLFRIEDVTM